MDVVEQIKAECEALGPKNLPGMDIIEITNRVGKLVVLAGLLSEMTEQMNDDMQNNFALTCAIIKHHGGTMTIPLPTLESINSQDEIDSEADEYSVTLRYIAGPPDPEPDDENTTDKDD